MFEQQIITLSKPDLNQAQQVNRLYQQLGLPMPIEPITAELMMIATIEDTAPEVLQTEPCTSVNDLKGIDAITKLVVVQIAIKSQLSLENYQWMARVRNMGSVRLIAIPRHEEQACDRSPGWINQLVALGFLRRAVVEDGPSEVNAPDNSKRYLLYFDIHQYKETPEWLNARHWANPELWNKYRW